MILSVNVKEAALSLWSAKQRSILALIGILVESIILCLTGGILGVLLGLGVSFTIARFSNRQFFISNIAVILGALASAAVGLFFGYYPARQAARMNPIDALRTE